MENFCVMGKEHSITKLEIIRRWQKNVYRGQQKISNLSNYDMAYYLHLQSLSYVFPCIHIYDLKLKTISMISHHNLRQICGISYADFLQTVCNQFSQTFNQIFWYMLQICPIARVHFKVSFGVAKIIESLMEHFLRILRESNAPKLSKH